MIKKSFLDENAGRRWLESNGHIDESEVVPSIVEVPVIEVDPESINNIPGEDTVIKELDIKKIIEKLEKRFTPQQMEFLATITLSPENFNFFDLNESDKLRYIDIVKRLKFLLKKNSFREDYFPAKRTESISVKTPVNPFKDNTFTREQLDELAGLLSS